MASADPLPEPIAEPALPTIKPRPPHPGFWWSLLWCLAFDALLFGTLISVVVLTLILTALASGDPREYMSRVTAGKLTEGDQAMLAAPGYLVGEVVSVLFAWLIIRAVVGRGWKRELAVRLPSAGHLALALLALPALLTLPDLVHQLARQVLPSFRDSGEDAKVIAQWPLWFGVLIIGVLPGVGEELWCRGFLGRGLVGRHGYLVGVLFTSFFFGLLHADPAYAVATAAMGVWLHFVYLTSRSLCLSMLLHFLNNTIAVVLAHVSIDVTTNQHVEQAQTYVYPAAGLLLLAVGWAMYRSRPRLVTDKESVAPWQPEFPGAACPPPDSGTRLVAGRAGVLGWGAVLAALTALAASAYFAWAATSVPP